MDVAILNALEKLTTHFNVNIIEFRNGVFVTRPMGSKTRLQQTIICAAVRGPGTTAIMPKLTVANAEDSIDVVVTRLGAASEDLD